MKRLLSAVLLIFSAGLYAQTTIVTATTIVGGDHAPLGTGRATWLPTDLNGNPIIVNMGTTPGLMLPRPAVCLVSGGAITTALNGSACTVVDTAVTNEAHFCYRLTIQDTVTKWTAPVMPCVQPTGSTWSLDYYVPTFGPTAPTWSGTDSIARAAAAAAQATANAALPANGCSTSTAGGGSANCPASISAGTKISAKEFGLGATPLTSDDSCPSGSYWIAPVLGSINSWRECSNGTVTVLGGTAFNPAAPGPIGGTTPAAASFTDVSASGTVAVGATLPLPPGSPCNHGSIWGANATDITPQLCGAVGDCSADDTTAVQACIDAGGDNSTCTFPAGSCYKTTSTLVIKHNNKVLRSEGGILLCTMTSTPCIQNGDSTPADNYLSNILENIRIEPGAQSTGDAVRDNAFGLVVKNPIFIENGANYFHNLIYVNADQQFHLDGANAVAHVIQCDSTWCGNVVYGNSVAVGWISNSSLSPVCQGNGIDWPFGNDLHLTSVIIQGFNQYGVRYGRGFDGYVLASKVHVESGGCGNPALNNINSNAGFIMNGGTLESDAGQLGGAYPNFPASGNTGSATWWYWVIIHSANSSSDTAPMPIGYTSSAPASWATGTTVTPIWPSIAPVGGDTITCSLLRTTDLNLAPYYNDGLADVVATGIPCGSGTYTSYADSIATTSLAVYAFSSPFFSFLPYLSNWPGSVVLGASGTDNQYASAKFSGSCVPGANFVTEIQPSGYTLPQVECVGPTSNFQAMPYGPVIFRQTSSYKPNFGSFALTLTNQFPFGVTPSNVKGVINFGQTGMGDIAQWNDSNIYKTMATNGNRPVADALDSATGMDGGLAQRSGTTISQYINSVFDTTSWLERLTATAKTFKVPITAPSLTLTGTGCVPGSFAKADGSGCGTPSAAMATGVPSWLQYFGDGSDGALTNASGNFFGDKNYTDFTIPFGNTVTVNSNGYGLIIHATGTCTIAGSLIGTGVAAAGNGIGGGSGGGSGGGTAVGTAGTVNTSTGTISNAGGTAGSAGGGNGGTGSGIPPVGIRYIFQTGGLSGGMFLGGAAGKAGGSSGGAAGNGGIGITLICQSFAGTDGSHTGVIDVSGGPGGNAPGDNTGAGSGGGGGIIIISTRSVAPTLPTLTVAGGAGGSCLTFTGCGTGGAGGAGWSQVISGW